MNATPSATTAPAPAARSVTRLVSLCESHFSRVLWGLLALATAIRLVMLREFWLGNPFARFPILDSELYWTRAGEMAAGSWYAGEPFHIAPLYAYFLGVLRWFGGGLLALYAVQLVLHLATAAVVGAATRERFGGGAACVAVALFLALAEPALFATRILGVTLQMLLLALLWWDWARLADAETPRTTLVLRAGAWIGLLTLAFPSALLLVPAYAAWLFLTATSARVGIARAGLGAAAAVLVISPATIHNAVATGEFIPVSTHAGITLAAGNAPGSVGIYTPRDDVSGAVKNQTRDSAQVFEERFGRKGSWTEIDAYFRNQVVTWWREHPLDAAVLFARKAYWFLTSRYYDNVASFELERRYGLLDSSRWVPLETPWIMGVALLGISVAFRRRRRFALELALLCPPLIVCVVFMYSARYRLVAVPVLCGLAGLAAVRWKELAWPRAAVAAVALLPVPLLLVNAYIGFGSIDFMREDFADLLSRSYLKAGGAHRQAGEFDAAETQFRRAAEVRPERSEAERELAALYLDAGAFASAREAALAALRRDHSDATAHRLLYDAQIGSGDLRNALVTLLALENLTPGDVPTQLALAWFYATCPDAKLRNGYKALRHALEAERLAKEDDPEIVMVRALAEAARGDFAKASDDAARGIALARARDDAASLHDFESLRERFLEGLAVEARPRLLRTE